MLNKRSKKAAVGVWGNKSSVKDAEGRGRGYGDGALLKMQRSKTSRSKRRDDDHDVEHQLHEATQEVF